jgi:copper chaperone CopZ
MKRRKCVPLQVALAVVFLANALQAASPDITRITVSDLDCAGCAKRVAKQLHTVPGVAKVETNVEARLMFVTPKPQSVLSPRALWEAVEKARKKPERLEGPSGTFTTKPQS